LILSGNKNDACIFGNLQTSLWNAVGRLSELHDHDFMPDTDFSMKLNITDRT